MHVCRSKSTVNAQISHTIRLLYMSIRGDDIELKKLFFKILFACFFDSFFSLLLLLFFLAFFFEFDFGLCIFWLGVFVCLRALHYKLL